MAPFRTRATRDAIAIALLALLVGKLVVGIDRVRDLPLDDEAQYQEAGVRLFAALGRHAHPPPAADWGPVYSAWYALLDLLCPDRIRLFDVSWSLLVLMLVVASYALARKLGMSTAGALLVGAWPLATSFFHVEPFPSHFYLLVLLVGAIVASSCRDFDGAASVLIATFGIAGFVRPEAAAIFVPCALAYVVRAVWSMARARAGAGRVVARVALALAPVTLLTWVFGNPLGSSRSFVAFAQHYAFDVTRREHLPIDPWLNYETIIGRDFGAVTTVGQALLANPLAVLRHALFNVRELPGNMLDLVSLRTSVTQLGSVPMLAASAVILVILTFVLVARLVRFARHGQRPGPLAVTVAVFAFACAACAPGAILVFPRAHYLVAPCALGALLALSWIDEALAGAWARVRERPGREHVVLIALAGGLWLVVPSARASTPSPMPVREAAHALRALRLQRATILELGPGFAAFAGYDYPTLSVWQKHEPWGSFLERNDVGIVIARDRYLTRNALADDPAMGLWLANPEQFGFCEVYVNPGFLRAFAKRSALDVTGSCLRRSD